MSSKAATSKATTESNAQAIWRQVQDAQRKRDQKREECVVAAERYATAEAELAIASDRLDRAMTADAAPAKPADVKP